MYYIISLLILIAISVLIICFMGKFTNTKLTNLIFVLIVVVCHWVHVIKIYFDVGAHDWNFLNTLPVANISPFMFCIVPFIFILPSKIKKYFLILISLLSVGMFLSPIISCSYFASINYKFHFSFLLDFVAHLSLFLLGIYLVKSKQIELKLKDSVVSGSIILCVGGGMLILNCIFDTSFWGLSLNGKHSIYNQVIVSNSYLSALLYFTGLIVVLILGFCFNKLLNFKCHLKSKKELQ